MFMKFMAVLRPLPAIIAVTTAMAATRSLAVSMQLCSIAAITTVILWLARGPFPVQRLDMTSVLLHSTALHSTA